jgi:hypothetical protein
LLTARGPKALILDPGEALLTAAQAPKEIGFLGMTLAARASGAFVVRTPRAIRQPAALTTLIHRLACRASNIVLWREKTSYKTMSVGRLVPDIGFSEPQSSGQPWKTRTVLTISLRGLRDRPTSAWYDAVASFARSEGLEVHVASQVREDEERSEEIANRLGATYLAWGDRNDSEQEFAVRDLYERSRYVISDRMHVLVFAALAGSVPLEVVNRPVRKIRDHFSLIGIEGISFDTEGQNSRVIQAFLSDAASVQPSIATKIAAAQDSLRVEERMVRQAILDR